MKKKNGLFVDSTKGSSDNIGMLIELKNVLLYEGEHIYCQLWVEDNSFLDSKKLLAEEDLYCCTFWLSHQREIQIRFEVKNATGQTLYLTEKIKTRASYAYTCDWEPKRLKLYRLSSEKSAHSELVATTDSNQVFVQDAVKEQDAVFVEPRPLANDKLGGLISKWGL